MNDKIEDLIYLFKYCKLNTGYAIWLNSYFVNSKGQVFPHLFFSDHRASDQKTKKK